MPFGIIKEKKKEEKVDFGNAIKDKFSLESLESHSLSDIFLFHSDDKRSKWFKACCEKLLPNTLICDDANKIILDLPVDFNSWKDFREKIDLITEDSVICPVHTNDGKLITNITRDALQILKHDLYNLTISKITFSWDLDVFPNFTKEDIIMLLDILPVFLKEVAITENAKKILEENDQFKNLLSRMLKHKEREY